MADTAQRSSGEARMRQLMGGADWAPLSRGLADELGGRLGIDMAGLSLAREIEPYLALDHEAAVGLDPARVKLERYRNQGALFGAYQPREDTIYLTPDKLHHDYLGTLLHEGRHRGRGRVSRSVIRGEVPEPDNWLDLLKSLVKPADEETINRFGDVMTTPTSREDAMKFLANVPAEQKGPLHRQLVDFNQLAREYRRKYGAPAKPDDASAARSGGVQRMSELLGAQPREPIPPAAPGEGKREPIGAARLEEAERAPLAKLMQLLAGQGRGNDTMLAHLTPAHARILQLLGGSGTRNPQTGLREFDDQGDNSGYGGDTTGSQGAGGGMGGGFGGMDSSTMGGYGQEHGYTGYNDLAGIHAAIDEGLTAAGLQDAKAPTTAEVAGFSPGLGLAGPASAATGRTGFGFFDKVDQAIQDLAKGPTKGQSFGLFGIGGRYTGEVNPNTGHPTATLSFDPLGVAGLLSPVASLGKAGANALGYDTTIDTGITMDVAPADSQPETSPSSDGGIRPITGVQPVQPAGSGASSTAPNAIDRLRALLGGNVAPRRSLV